MIASKSFPVLYVPRPLVYSQLAFSYYYHERKQYFLFHLMACLFVQKVRTSLLGILYSFIYLFLAVLGLCYFAQAFSSCSKWELLQCCAGFSLQQLLVAKLGSGAQAQQLAAHGLTSCSEECGIFPDQGLNSSLWQEDSLPLNYQGSPSCILLNLFMLLIYIMQF